MVVVFMMNSIVSLKIYKRWLFVFSMTLFALFTSVSVYAQEQNKQFKSYTADEIYNILNNNTYSLQGIRFFQGSKSSNQNKFLIRYLENNGVVSVAGDSILFYMVDSKPRNISFQDVNALNNVLMSENMISGLSHPLPFISLVWNQDVGGYLLHFETILDMKADLDEKYIANSFVSFIKDYYTTLQGFDEMLKILKENGEYK